MEKYDNGFSRNEKSLGIFENQELWNDIDDINAHLWLLVHTKTKRYNLSECETTIFLYIYRELL